MQSRYTPRVAGAGLVLSVISITYTYFTSHGGAAEYHSAVARQDGPVLCLNGFAYHLQSTSKDSDYGGAEVLEVIKEFRGEPITDENGHEVMRKRYPKACSNI